MNKTLYIGAKCVPSFYIGSGGSSAWASGVPYEPLTVVTYNGSWYISKIAVPASTTAPAAGTYWAKVPGYLTELDASFIEWAQEHIGDLETDVSGLDTRLDAAEDDIAELKDDLSDSVRFDIAQIKTDEEKAQARANIGIEDSEVYAENVVAEYEIVTEPPKTYNDIRTALTGQTTQGKWWNFTTGSADTDSVGVYARFNISGRNLIYIDGYNEDENRRTGAFYDASNNLIEIIFNDITGRRGFMGCPVSVPANASYVILNGYNAEIRPLPPAVYVLTGAEEEVGVMRTLSGELTMGKAWKSSDASQTTGTNYQYVRYNTIPNAEKIYVTGVSWSQDWAFVSFYNSNESLLQVYYNYNATYYTEVEITIPTGSAYFIVNGLNNDTRWNAKVRYAESTRGKVPTKMQSEFNDELKPLIEKKFLFVGDSYGEGYSHDGNNDGWCEYLAGYMGLDLSEYKILTSSGSGFSQNDFATVLDSEQGTGYTDIVICAGYNDHYFTKTEILSGILAFENVALSKWPNIRIHVGFIAYIKAGSGTGAEPTWADIRNALVNTVLPAYQESVTLGCRYLNNVEYWLGESGLTPSDGYHPSAQGNQSIAKAVANAILTGSAPLPYNVDLRVD